MPEDDFFSCCVTVFRPDARFSAPLAETMAINYADTILKPQNFQPRLGVERNDEERGGALLEV